MTDLLRPQDLKKISDDLDMEMAKKAMAKMAVAEREKKELEQIFMDREIHPEARTRINNAITRAAQQGLNQIKALSFPASYCNDRGRRINNLEADWPDSLEGFGRKAYDYYMAELKPLGYRLTAQILDYPDGMPGTVALYLNWDR